MTRENLLKYRLNIIKAQKGMCLDCGPGSHTNNVTVGGITCSPCDGGTFSLGTTKECSLCERGTFSTGGAVGCKPCATGTYAVRQGLELSRFTPLYFLFIVRRTEYVLRYFLQVSQRARCAQPAASPRSRVPLDAFRALRATFRSVIMRA